MRVNAIIAKFITLACGGVWPTERGGERICQEIAATNATNIQHPTTTNDQSTVNPFSTQSFSIFTISIRIPIHPHNFNLAGGTPIYRMRNGEKVGCCGLRHNNAIRKSSIHNAL